MLSSNSATSFRYHAQRDDGASSGHQFFSSGFRCFIVPQILRTGRQNDRKTDQGFLFIVPCMRKGYGYVNTAQSVHHSHRVVRRMPGFFAGHWSLAATGCCAVDQPFASEHARLESFRAWPSDSRASLHPLRMVRGRVELATFSHGLVLLLRVDMCVCT